MSHQICRAITVVFQEDKKLWAQLFHGPLMTVDLSKGESFSGVARPKQIEKLNNVCVEAFDFFLPNGSIMLDVPYGCVLIQE